MRESRAPRVIRGALAACFATFTALLAHVAAGGAMPNWVGVALPLAIATLVCSALAGRRISLLRTTLSVAVSQVLFHLLFVLGTADSMGASVGGHAHHGVETLTVGVVNAPHAHLSAAMTIGHVAAGAVTVAALYFAERAVRAALVFAHRARSWFVHLIHPVVLPSTVRRRPMPAAAFDVELGALSRIGVTLPRRGPPTLILH